MFTHGLEILRPVPIRDHGIDTAHLGGHGPFAGFAADHAGSAGMAGARAHDEPLLMSRVLFAVALHLLLLALPPVLAGRPSADAPV